MAFSGCGIAILPCLSYWFGTSLERRYMARQHIGTFAANMAACFVYAALSAWLGGTRRTVGRAKEYVNRGCGMGMCGGLSTMSTLALEEFTMLHDGKAMDCAAYCCTTFIVGCLLAYVGAHVGLRFAGTEHNDGDRHAMGKEAD